MFVRRTLAAALLLLVAPFGGAGGGEPERPSAVWPEPPYFSPLTVPFGNTYTLLHAGTLAPIAGTAPFFGIFYASYTRDQGRVVTAAQELFDAMRLLAEKQGHTSAVVVAYFDLVPGQDLSSVDSYGIGYRRTPVGAWVRSELKGTAPESTTRRSQSPPIARDERAESAARATTVAWLAVLDGGLYAKAWGSGSSLLTKRFSVNEFSRMAKGIRDTKGRVIDRRPLSTFARTRAPGLPEGSYVVFDFESKFDKVAGVVERVTTALDNDGVWRVMGYSVY